MRRWIGSISVVLVVLFSAEVRATTCPAGTSPFTDVLNSDFFCTDVLWLRNANVTQGCGTGTTFCPSQNVTRAQMALFMRRFAEATQPTFQVGESATTPSGDLDAGGVTFCANQAIGVPATGANPRYAQASGSVSIFTSGLADVQLKLTRNTNGGAFQDTHLVNPLVTVPGGQWVHVTVTSAPDDVLAPGNGYLWRMELTRAPGSSTTGEVLEVRCQIKITSTVDPSGS